MAERLIAWVDLLGRYRTRMPVYAELRDRLGLNEDQALAWAWRRLIEDGKSGLESDHPHYMIDVTIYRRRFHELEGNYFRYGALPDGPCGNCDARDGAWSMDLEGLPEVMMPLARGVQMNKIRLARNSELMKLDLPSLRALETGDTMLGESIQKRKQTLRDIPQQFDLTTLSDAPGELRAKWPLELLPIRA